MFSIRLCIAVMIMTLFLLQSLFPPLLLAKLNSIRKIIIVEVEIVVTVIIIIIYFHKMTGGSEMIDDIVTCNKYKYQQFHHYTMIHNDVLYIIYMFLLQILIGKRYWVDSYNKNNS